jgi:LmbE family N-acetylglucosaminyl deacetylase
MNILAFFAHPDDETMLAGGALALLAELGHTVHYLICTRGEGGETGVPPLCEQARLGEWRAKEAQNAVTALGGKSLVFLDYIDPVVGPDNRLFTFCEDIDQLSFDLSRVIKKLRIEIVISHGSNGEYGHPGHKTVYQAAKRYFDREHPSGLAWYTAQASYENALKPHLINKDDPASWVINTQSVLDRKIAAARAHVSQNALFVRRMQKELARKVVLEEVIVSEEAYHLAYGNKDYLLPIFEIAGAIKK